MKTYRHNMMFFLVMAVVFICTPAQADEFSDTIDFYRSVPAVQPFFENAYGYAVFPVIGKGGLGIGGAYGKGRVYRNGEPTGDTSLVKISIGLQAGGQVFSEMIFFQDQRSYEEFTRGGFEFDATASAVAVTAGAQAGAGTTGTSAGASAGPATGAQAQISYYKGMAVFVHAKGGFMFEASIGGQRFDFTPVE